MGDAKQLDVSAVDAPPPGSGAMGFDFLQKQPKSALTSALFSDEHEDVGLPQISRGDGGGNSASKPGMPTRNPKPELKPIDREDFSAEAMERQRAEQLSARQQEQQRLAAYQNTITTYNDLVPLPPPESPFKKFEPYVVYITLGVALLLLILFFWQKRTTTTSDEQK